MWSRGGQVTVHTKKIFIPPIKQKKYRKEVRLYLTQFANSAGIRFYCEEAGQVETRRGPGLLLQQFTSNSRKPNLEGNVSVISSDLPFADWHVVFFVIFTNLIIQRKFTKKIFYGVSNRSKLEILEQKLSLVYPDWRFRDRIFFYKFKKGRLTTNSGSSL